MGLLMFVEVIGGYFYYSNSRDRKVFDGLGTTMSDTAAGYDARLKREADEAEARRTRDAKLNHDRFLLVTPGMSYYDVCEKLGGAGRLVSSAGAGRFLVEIYQWADTAYGVGVATCLFHAGELAQKAQAGLR